MKFLIRCGMGGGFGGPGEWEEIEAENIEDAEKQAESLAREKYEYYEGLHGIRDVNDIMGEELVDEDEANHIYEEEIETWIVYEAKPAE